MCAVCKKGWCEILNLNPRTPIPIQRKLTAHNALFSFWLKRRYLFIPPLCFHQILQIHASIFSLSCKKISTCYLLLPGPSIKLFFVLVNSAEKLPQSIQIFFGAKIFLFNLNLLFTLSSTIMFLLQYDDQNCVEYSSCSLICVSLA